MTALALTSLLAPGAAIAQAANNPGTGDTGFFTFRPAAAAGTQINVASGNALIRTRDLADGPLTYNVVVDRTYNSLAPDTYTILSARWTFDIGPDTKLMVESNQDATVAGPSGYRIRFARQPDGSYVAPDDFDGSLIKTASGWTLTRTSQNDEFGFDGSGNLTWTKDSELRDFTVQGTSAAGRTVLYGTNSGRRVNLSYNGDSLVRLMDDPASGHHYYRYTSGRLTEYESPTGAKTTYGYDSNGLLDEIVEPGGTTVALDVAASGKVHSITTTLPGGVPQTTSFVYTRRTHKTDVTAPDATRRTYAYDDDWRVTRDYNPDVVPTVTASGELRDLADDYVGPNRTYPLTVEADQPDGAGLRRLLAEREDGTELLGENVPCTTTPFDLVCPTEHATNLDADFASVPEGALTIRAAADDDEEHHATSDSWTVYVDKTPPSSPDPASLVGGEFANGETEITWEPGTDPLLADGSDPSGEATTRIRTRVPGGTWSAWEDTDQLTHGLPAPAPASVEVELQTVDAVGNASPVASGTVMFDPDETDGCDERNSPAPSLGCDDMLTGPAMDSEDDPDVELEVDDIFDDEAAARTSNPAKRYWVTSRSTLCGDDGDSNCWVTTRYFPQSFTTGNMRMVNRDLVLHVRNHRNERGKLDKRARLWRTYFPPSSVPPKNYYGYNDTSNVCAWIPRGTVIDGSEITPHTAPCSALPNRENRYWNFVQRRARPTSNAEDGELKSVPKGVKPVWINCFWDGANNDKPAELMPQKTWGPDCHTSSIRLKWPTDPTLKAQMANQPLAICANVFTNRNAPYSARLKCRNEDRVFTDLIDDIRDHKDEANYIGVRVGGAMWSAAGAG